MSNLTLQDLKDQCIVFDDDDDEPPYEVNCSDVFFWGCSQGVEVSEETLPMLNQAVADCDGDVIEGATLYCARQLKTRPQGAVELAKKLLDLIVDV